MCILQIYNEVVCC